VEKFVFGIDRLHEGVAGMDEWQSYLPAT
jgi:hypothetical protein